MAQQGDAGSRSPRRRGRVVRGRKAVLALEKREQLECPCDVVAREPGRETFFDPGFIVTAKRQRAKRAERRKAPERHRIQQATLSQEYSQLELDLLERPGLAKNSLAHLDRGPAIHELALVDRLHCRRGLEAPEQFLGLANAREEPHRLFIGGERLRKMSSSEHHRAIHARRKFQMIVAIQKLDACLWRDP